MTPCRRRIAALLLLRAAAAFVAPRPPPPLRTLRPRPPPPLRSLRRAAAPVDAAEEIWCPNGECEVLTDAAPDQEELSLKERVLSWLGRRRSRSVEPGKLVLVRHGESTWNANKTFSGWVDVDLNGVGEREVEHAARLMMERGLTIDVVYTSLLKRAIRSAWILLRESKQSFRPVVKDWRLNERHYGAFQGRSKPGLAALLGYEQVRDYRAGFVARPPALPRHHALSPFRERKYTGVAADDLPLTESLRDCLERALPVYEDRIKADVLNGKDVVVVAHGNALRGLVKAIDGLSDDVIENVAIPNGIPLVYEFARSAAGDLVPVPGENAEGKLSGEFLEEKGALREALEFERARTRPESLADPSEDISLLWGVDKSTVLSPLEQSLAKLQKERRLMAAAAAEFNVPVEYRVADDVVRKVTRGALREELAREKASNVFKGTRGALREEFAREKASKVSFAPGAKTAASSAVYKDAFEAAAAAPRRRRSVRPPAPGEARPPLVVIIRHGKTTHNKLGLFTGWEDAQLAPEGRAEAAAAGALMRAHGVEVDVVYTSWLTRAIETAWLVLSPLDALWVTIHKSWRLNERMYGRLTGLSKRMIKQKHGDDQFMKWRRGYRERPPPASPFSPFYPGNDERYQKYVSDVPISLRQSLIRSLGHGRLELHRKFPRAESLKDCMDRTIPYYQNTIYPQTIAKNRTVLIASSENAIRGLLMHLCDIPIANISNVEIPTGVPLIYDIAGRCVHLFDDGQLPKPRDRYDFGEAADLLFRPCDYDDDDGCDLLDPHLYLDDKFHRGDGGLGPDIEAAAEREAWERVLEIGEDDEFTTEERDFWVKEIREGATEFDDEPAEVEI